MTYDHGAWQFVARVIQSEGDDACQRFLLAHLSPECLNGIAAEVTLRRGTPGLTPDRIKAAWSDEDAIYGTR